MLLLWLLLVFMTIRQESAGFKMAIGRSCGEGLTRFQQAKSAEPARYYGYR